MSKVKYIIVFSILFIGLALGLEFTWNMYHEQAHRQFAVYNGCTDYEIHYFPSGSFLCTGRSYETMTEQSVRDEYMLDSFNEIITYNIGVLYQTVLMCSFIITLAIFLTYKDK